VASVLEDLPFDDETKRTIAENEVRFRAANERIEKAGKRFGVDESTVPFICECGRLSCVEVIRTTIDQYEEVRANPRRFMCVTGHEITAGGIGRLVGKGSGFVIVEKLGVAAEVAAENDPR